MFLTGCPGGRRSGRPAPGTLLGGTVTGRNTVAPSLRSLHASEPPGGVAGTLTPRPLHLPRPGCPGYGAPLRPAPA